MIRPGIALKSLILLAMLATATGQTITDAFTQLRNHINGGTTLTAAQINAQAAIINNNISKLGTDSVVIADALSLVSTYETKKGALFTVAPTKGGYLRDATGFELPNAMLDLEQGILDRTYTAASLAQNEALLNGWKIKSSAHFPGSVTAPADPNASRSVQINASQPKVWGAPVMYHDYDARRPTGSYLAPGSIGVVTVPAALVNKGFKVRVGAHSWDLGAKDRIERLDRVSRVFAITSTTTKIANPLGGGIYIEVPYLANAGLVSVQIANAVRSPFFSATSFRKTTLSEWQTTERTHPGPWADFESDKFMMQVPRSWIYAYSNPLTLMANWDKAMDAVSDLMGLPQVRPKTVMYAQVDVIMRSDVNAPGYPCVNDTYDPYAATNGNKSHYLLTGPQNSPWAALHELGHGHSFTKFTGETESAVNLYYVAVLNQKFGMALEAAFGESIGAGGSVDMTTLTLKNISLMWTLKNVFRTGNKTMLTADMSYEHKGHAKYVEIAKLFGWDALGEFWKSVHVDYGNGITYPTNSDPTDSRILRMSKAAGVDLRPLLHFWGAPPISATTLKNSITAAGLKPSGAIYRRLIFYRNSVPATQSDYNNFYWAIDQTGADSEIKAMFDDKTYTTAIANSAVSAIQGIINLYFPNGDPDVPSRTWDITPGVAGEGNGVINTGAGNWNNSTANWTGDAGSNNALWANGSDAVFGSGIYTVSTAASGITVGNLNIGTGGGTITIRSATDNGGLTVNTGSVWSLSNNSLVIPGDQVNDTKLTMASGGLLSVAGSGTFDTGEKPSGADWAVSGCALEIGGTLTLRGNPLGVGKFASITMASGTSFVHERNLAGTYANNWNLSGTGQIVFSNRYAVTSTFSGVISGSAAFTKSGAGTLTLAAGNTYTNKTVVNEGTLKLTHTAAVGSSSRIELAAGALLDVSAVPGWTLGVSKGLNGKGSIAGVVVCNGSISPGLVTAELSSLTFDSHLTLNATSIYNVEVSPTGLACDKLAVAGNLRADGAISVTFAGTPTFVPVAGSQFDVVDAASISGTPVVTGTLPAGLVWDTSRFASDGFIRVISSSPFFAWADEAGLSGDDALASADPDGDGSNNLIEFALNGNPKDGSNNGLVACVPSGAGLTLVVAVRDGAVFSAAAGRVQTTALAVDGVFYTVEGSTDFVFPGGAVSESGKPSETAPFECGLPSLGNTPWEYHSFRLPVPDGGSGKGFLRMKLKTP